MIRPAFLLLAGLSWFLSSPGFAEGKPTGPGSQVGYVQDGIDAVLAAAKRNQVVGVAEAHRNVEVHDFLQSLVRDPRFPDAFDDIVVEFGNQRYQGLMDRYLGGEEISHDSLALAWRNTTQMFVWDSPLYEDFFRTVREVNLGLPSESRLRVLLGDPPIDWEAVRTADDFPREYGYRDPNVVRLIEREVLARNRRALLIFGGHHLLRRSPADGFKPRPLDRASIGEAMDLRHPGALFVIWTVVGKEPLAARIGHWQAGTLRLVRGSELRVLSSEVLFGEGIVVFRLVDGERRPVTLKANDFPPLSSQIDAVLYLGESSRTLRAPLSVYRDAAYVAELRRRACILKGVFGYDYVAALDALVESAEEPLIRDD